MSAPVPAPAPAPAPAPGDPAQAYSTYPLAGPPGGPAPQPYGYPPYPYPPPGYAVPPMPMPVPMVGPAPGPIQHPFSGVVPQALPADYNANIVVVESMRGSNSVVEIQEYQHLGANVGNPERLLTYNALGLRMRRIHVRLEKGQMRAEAGALHYMCGDLQLSADTGGASGLLKKAVTGALSHETAVKPLYSGTGDVYLEPRFGYYGLLHLNNEECIVDKGVWYAAEGSLKISVEHQKNVSSSLFGGEGFWQTKISGSGWAVLELPVPPYEIHKFQLRDSKLSVDGSFAILRKGDVEFKVEKSTKSLIGSSLSGEGLLQVFKGTGEVWVCPTADHYPPMMVGAPSQR